MCVSEGFPTQDCLLLPLWSSAGATVFLLPTEHGENVHFSVFKSHDQKKTQQYYHPQTPLLEKQGAAAFIIVHLSRVPIKHASAIQKDCLPTNQDALTPVCKKNRLSWLPDSLSDLNEQCCPNTLSEPPVCITCRLLDKWFFFFLNGPDFSGWTFIPTW